MTPMFQMCFISLDSSIKAVYFYYAALIVQFSIVLCHGLPTNNNAFVIPSFVLTLPWFLILLFLNKGSSFLVE